MGNLPPSASLRPPPPPGCHLIEANNEEGNAMMKGNNNNDNNDSRTYYFRRCKRLKPTNINNLPDDLLFEILSHLPAQDIYNLSMLVCWKWHRMIHTHSFIHTHIQHSPLGLLIQPLVEFERSIFVSMREGRIEISKLSYEFRCPAFTSSNGLVLGFETRNPYSYYILNPATKQYFTLPLFSHQISNSNRCGCGIAYAASSMEYKVVLHYNYSELQESKLHIVTVGVDDSWRVINTQHLSSKFTKRVVFFNAPLITEGFVHWIDRENRWQVLTLNVETEVVTETYVPITPQEVDGEKMKHNFVFLTTGRYVSLLIGCGGYLWQVWEMKPESGEWRKMPDIDLEAQKWRFEQNGESLWPAAWLNYPEVLVFWIRANDTYAFYNLRTHEIYIYNGIGGLPRSRRLLSVVHRESLEWLTPGS